MADSYAFRP